METAELVQLIKTRRSIRRFQDKPVPEDLLVQAIDAATWAPNAGNGQNWLFFIFLNKKVINAVADAIDADMKTILSWPEMVNARHPPRTDVLRTAPALIVVATSASVTNPGFGGFQDNAVIKRAKTDPKANRMSKRDVGGRIQSTSAAVAYLILVLHQMGLGSLWMAGALHAKEEIEKVLKLPPCLDVVNLVPVGYPAQNPKGCRKPVSEVYQVIK